MDYQAFYQDVAEWIILNQKKANLLGFDSEDYFEWVYQSAGEIGNKYNNTELVKKQMLMLLEWIEKKYREYMIQKSERS